MDAFFVWNPPITCSEPELYIPAHSWFAQLAYSHRLSVIKIRRHWVLGPVLSRPLCESAIGESVSERSKDHYPLYKLQIQGGCLRKSRVLFVQSPHLLSYQIGQMTKLGILLTDSNHSLCAQHVETGSFGKERWFQPFLFFLIYFFAIAKPWRSKFDWTQLSNSLSCILTSAELQDLDGSRAERRQSRHVHKYSVDEI